MKLIEQGKIYGIDSNCIVRGSIIRYDYEQKIQDIELGLINPKTNYYFTHTDVWPKDIVLNDTKLLARYEGKGVFCELSTGIKLVTSDNPFVSSYIFCDNKGNQETFNYYYENPISNGDYPPENFIKTFKFLKEKPLVIDSGIYQINNKVDFDEVLTLYKKDYKTFYYLKKMHEYASISFERDLKNMMNDMENKQFYSFETEKKDHQYNIEYLKKY